MKLKHIFLGLLLVFCLPQNGWTSTKLENPLTFEGEIVKGDQEARKLGYPTANLHSKVTEELGRGVYAGTATFGEKSYKAMCYAGPIRDEKENPSRTEILEVNILGFDGDLYGKTMTVELTHFIREDEKIPFENWEQFSKIMKKKLADDLKAVQKALSTED